MSTERDHLAHGSEQHPASAREAALEAWSGLHGGIDPRNSFWVRNWVLISHACARPLVRLGLTPNTVTALGVIATAVGLCLTILGEWWPLLAAVVIVVAALLDGIDGAIAAQTGTASRWGRINDAVADRFSDVMLVGIVVVVGAPPWIGATLAVLTLILEITRATAQAVGMKGPGAVTVWERPSRVILAVVAAASSTLWWKADLQVADVLATAIAMTGTVLALIGTIQLGVAVRRQTRGLG
ncbi:CDP-alcohol phosphatidyltransferase family protein [Gordonia terrae]|uniref:CDP-alcohol phosphatidyltransferase family protein n=1 Tax=Gordonia terrae TaxID=2055 RepID=UPI003F6B25F7